MRKTAKKANSHQKSHFHVLVSNKNGGVTNQTVDFGGGRSREMIIVSGFSHMIRDSVMNGVYYPAEAFDNLANMLDYPDAVIHAPAGHPESCYGGFMSAKDPRALVYNVGAYHFNWRVEGDRLMSDLAIDPEMAAVSSHGRRILSRIKDQKPIDGSTAFDCMVRCDAGVAPDGEVYNRVAFNLELDHSAILIDEEGAKTGKEGVGMFVNAGSTEEVEISEVTVNAEAANMNLPVAPPGHEWDADAAVMRIRKFTGSEDAPTSNYRKFFAYFDPENTDDFGAYKLPFADVIDKRPHAVPRAISAIKGAISGARGGVDIPESAKADAMKVVEHYEKKMEDQESETGDDISANSKIIQAVNSILQIVGVKGYNSTTSEQSSIQTEVSNSMDMKKKMMGMLKKMKPNMDEEELKKMENMSEEDMLNMMDKYMGNMGDKDKDKSGDKDKAKNSAEGADQDQTGKKASDDGTKSDPKDAAIEALTNSVKALTDKIDGLEKQVNSGDAEKRKSLLKHLPMVNSDIAKKLSTEDLEKMAAEQGHVAFSASNSYQPKPGSAEDTWDMKLPNSKSDNDKSDQEAA